MKGLKKGRNENSDVCMIHSFLHECLLNFLKGNFNFENESFQISGAHNKKSAKVHTEQAKQKRPFPIIARNYRKTIALSQKKSFMIYVLVNFYH